MLARSSFRAAGPSATIICSPSPTRAVRHAPPAAGAAPVQTRRCFSSNTANAGGSIISSSRSSPQLNVSFSGSGFLLPFHLGVKCYSLTSPAPSCRPTSCQPASTRRAISRWSGGSRCLSPQLVKWVYWSPPPPPPFPARPVSLGNSGERRRVFPHAAQRQHRPQRVLTRE